MWQVDSVTRPRRTSMPVGGGRYWCPPSYSASAPATARPARRRSPQTITDKGTPFGDLLVPKLTASVTDGAVGVTVDAPVTVSAEDGVLGAVTMTDDDGAPGRRPS